MNPSPLVYSFFDIKAKILARLYFKPAPANCGFHVDSAQLLQRLRTTRERALVQTGSPVVMRLARELDGFLCAAQPVGIFVWNGSGLAAALAIEWARQRDIPTLFCENGYLPNTLQLDLNGVNARSTLRERLRLDEIAALTYSAEQCAELAAVLNEYRAGRVKPPLPPVRVRPSGLAYLRQGWRDWWERPPHRRINRRIGREVPPLPPRFVLLPLQVASDSQLTLHSPVYGNRLALVIADVETALRVIDPKLALVVKLHPADRNKTDYDAVVAAHPAVIWVGGGALQPVLARAECVVTINSTVGIEALIFGKTVVALGENFYVRDGLVYSVRDRAELVVQLRRALNELPNAELIQQYLHYLYFHGLVRANWRDHAPASVNALAQQMRVLIELD